MCLLGGYGFVHYETEEAAKEAIAKVNGMQIAGSRIQLDHVRLGNSKGSEQKNDQKTLTC